MSHSELIVPRLLEVVAALFVVGAALILLIASRAGPKAAARLWTVYFGEIAILAIILVPAYLGTLALLISLLGIGLVSEHELNGALHRLGLAPRDHLGLAAGAGLLLATALGGESHFQAAFFLAVLVILGADSLRGRPQPSLLPRGAATVLGLVYPTALLAHLLLIAKLEDGFGYVVFLFGLIEINDSAALLVGLLVGGPKLWPSMSPSKTVAGSVAGLGATLAGAGLLAFAVPAFTPLQSIIAGVVIGVVGQAGDLVGSSIKRAAGLKDFSNLVPGQGGMLDIFDSLTLTAPAFYYYVRYLSAGWTSGRP